MRRALQIAACLACLLAWTAPSSAAQPGWGSPLLLGTDGHRYDYSQYTDSIAMTADGAAVAIWGHTGAAETTLSLKQPGSDSVTSEQLPASAKVAADGLGYAYVSYLLNGDGDAAFRVRAPGGTFGPEQVLPTRVGPQAPHVVASRDGDVALVWQDSGGLYAAFRPKDGAFGTPQYLASFPVGYWMNNLDAALSVNGDLVVAGATYAGENSAPSRLFTIVRTEAGDVRTGVLSDGSLRADSPSVGIDDSGRAVVVWTELDPKTLEVRDVLVAQRAAGQGFGTRTRLHRTRMTRHRASAAMSHDGRYTLSTPVRLGRRVYTGNAGGAPRRLRSYYDGGGWVDTHLAASPSGDHLLLTLFPNFKGAVTGMRTGDGAFEPMQDIRRDCATTGVTMTAVGEGGRQAALLHDDGGGVWLTVGADVPEQRTCFPTDQWNPNPYLDDPYVPKPPNYDQGPGGGSWEPGGPPSGGPPPPAPGSVLLGLPSIRAASAGTTYPSRVVVVCGKACDISASVTLRFDRNGDVLGRAKARRSSSGKPTIVEIPIRLTPAAAKRVRQAMRKRGKRALLLQFTVTASGRKLAKSTRTVTTIVGP